MPPDESRFRTLPSHRRSNTEYIARPPVFDNPAHNPTSDDHFLRSQAAPVWMETFPKKKLEARARILSDWFQGKNDTGESDTNMRSGTAGGHTRKNSTPVAGRFSFFGLRRTAEPSFQIPEPAEDELLNLDLEAALSLPEIDTNPEEAMNNLRDQASTVLHRMQEAYKQRTFAMHQALADRDEKLEELEETRARVDHLKMQLDGMAAKVMDQERAMKAMADDLEREKNLRQREQSSSRGLTMRTVASEEDNASLVLQAPHRNSKRTSHGTFASDSGFESGDESVTDSIFSNKESLESPTSTIAAPSQNLSHLVMSATSPVPASNPSTPTQKTLNAPGANLTPARSSAYERVIKGIASTRFGGSLVGNTNPCNICHGVPSSEAWSVMGILKDENRGLKSRLGELELVIDDCLGLVGP